MINNYYNNTNSILTLTNHRSSFINVVYLIFGFFSGIVFSIIQIVFLFSILFYCSSSKILAANNAVIVQVLHALRSQPCFHSVVIDLTAFVLIMIFFSILIMSLLLVFRSYIKLGVAVVYKYVVALYTSVVQSQKRFNIIRGDVTLYGVVFCVGLLVPYTLVFLKNLYYKKININNIYIEKTQNLRISDDIKNPIINNQTRIRIELADNTVVPIKFKKDVDTFNFELLTEYNIDFQIYNNNVIKFLKAENKYMEDSELNTNLVTIKVPEIKLDRDLYINDQINVIREFYCREHQISINELLAYLKQNYYILLNPTSNTLYLTPKNMYINTIYDTVIPVSLKLPTTIEDLDINMYLDWVYVGMVVNNNIYILFYIVYLFILLNIACFVLYQNIKSIYELYIRSFYVSLSSDLALDQDYFNYID